MDRENFNNRRDTTMKVIAGAIIMLASALCVLAAATVYTPQFQGTTDSAVLCSFAGFVFFLLGLYFLFFAKDKRE